MIIEDEDGHIVTTDEIHHCEPGEPEPEPAPTMEQLKAALATYQRGRNPFEDHDPAERSNADQAADFLLDAMPQLLADLAAAHERLARYEEAPTREDWTVTADAATPPRSSDPLYTASAALSRASRAGQAWRRVVTHSPVIVRPWEPISTEPPF